MRFVKRKQKCKTRCSLKHVHNSSHVLYWRKVNRSLKTDKNNIGCGKYCTLLQKRNAFYKRWLEDGSDSDFTSPRTEVYTPHQWTSTQLKISSKFIRTFHLWECFLSKQICILTDENKLRSRVTRLSAVQRYQGQSAMAKIR